MSLKIWLPLNGNIENQGLADVTITNNGATVDNNGKIGKCYSFNGSSNYVQLTNSIIEGKKPFTFSVWYKTTSGNSYYPIISVGTSFKGFTIHGKVNRLEGGDGTNHFNSSNHIVASSIGTWTHLAVTYDGTKIQSYLNGTPNANSLFWTYGFGTGNTTIKIGHFWGGYFKGCINDFRLYDECLSANQIKEISRGMVLHYKMCQPERNENLYVYNSISTGGFSLLDVPYPSFSHNSVTRTTTITNNGGGALRISNLGLNGYSGHLTISFYAWASKACSFSLDCCDYDCIPSINLTTVKKKFVVNTNHVTDKYNTSNNYNGFIDWNFSNTSGAIIYIQDLKVEKGENPNPQWSPAPSDNPNWGTIEYDGSGFKNHGTVSGNVTLSADSPRYTGSYSLADGKYITAPGLTYINSGSISFWAKINTLASNGWLPFTGPTNSHYIMASTGGTGSFYHNAAGNGTKTIYEDGKVITAPSSIGVWHHYVITNVDLTTWTKFMINNYDYNWNANMQMSDIRVYSTILDATAVAELYKLGRN